MSGRPAVIDRKFIEDLLGRGSSGNIEVHSPDVPGGMVRGKVTRTGSDFLIIIVGGNPMSVRYRRITSASAVSSAW